ncbi:MAG: zinc-ribbon domain-containing protein [Candidatus Kariarchaeaceae archaeon]|jgi:uncharacterized membrane protein YvbJ
MSKQSSVCSACGEDNAPDSTFCLNCGAKMREPSSPDPSLVSSDEEESIEEQRKKQLQSIPPLVGVVVFLTIIDYMDNQSIDWAYWPAIPIIIFAIIVPYFTLRIGQ